MACKKITKTNKSDSKLIETLEKIFENEYKAEAAYSYFESDDFINEFGDYIEGYSKADKSFSGRVDDNGEPMLFYDDTAQKYFFVDKDKNNVFYPFVKRGLRSVFNYKQTDKIVSRLALNYFNKSGLNFLNFDTIEFEERKSLPNLKEFIKNEIENKVKELEEKGGKFKLQALVLKKSLLHLNEYVEKVDSFYKKISLKRSDVDDQTDLKVENEETKDPSFSKSSFEQDSKNAISSNVKLKLSLLENNEDLDPIWNEPTFKDFDDVYSTLIHNITNLVALEGEDLFELQKNEIERLSIKKPYLKQLLSYLNNKSFSEKDKNQFAQAFNLHGNNFLVSEVQTKFKDENNEVKKGYTHNVMEVSESGSKSAIVTSEWGNNFKNLFLDDNNKLKESHKELLLKIQGELKELKENIKPTSDITEFKNYINSFVNITRKLGIELTENGITNFLDNNGALSFDIASQIDNLSKATTQIEIGTKKALKTFVKNKTDFKNPFNEEGVFKKLAKAESFFMSEGSDASIWSSGKNKWLFSYPSYLSTRIKQWQKNPELLRNWFNSSAYNQGSALMKYLLAEDLDKNMVYEEGDKERIIQSRLENLKLGIFNTFQEKNEDFSDVSDLSFKDYFNDAVNKTLSQSFSRTVTPGDKGTDYQIRTGFFVDAYSNTNENKEVDFTYETEEVFFNYFNSEVNRMKEAHKEVDSFKDSPEKLTVDYHFKDGSSIDSKNGNAFKSQYFPELSYDSTSSNAKVNAIKDALYVKRDGLHINQIKHTADVKSNKELTSLIKEYISDNLREGVNNTILNLIKENTFVLDANGELENKGIDKSTFEKYSENNLLNKEETLKAIATDFYINSLINNIEYSKLFTGDVAFYKDMVDYKKRVPATYTDGLQLRLKKGEEFFNIATTSKVKITPTEYAKIEEILGKEGAKAYQGTNSADGQAWITPERWKFLMERLGKWSDVHDSVYKKMNSDNPEAYTKEELKVSTQSLKGVYFYMNGKTPTFLKYSQAVLTKQLVKGTGLQTIFNQMQEQKVDELITLDGIKVGSSTPTTVHNTDGAVKDKFTFNVSQLSNYGWKLQQDLPTKTIKETDIGSQIQKNIFAGLLFNKELSGFELDNNFTNGQTVINNIVDIVEALIGTGLSEIKEEFKVFRNGEIKNIKGFYNALVRELEKRDGSKNIIDALNKQTALYGMPQSIDKITNIFSSVMNNHLIKIKTNGGSFIQMSNFGINKNEASEQGVIMHPDLKNGSTTYEPHYYKDENGKTKVKPGGVFISGSFIAKYIPDYKKYDNVDLFIGRDGNPPIIDERIRKNLIGYRIPNQGLSSNDALEIIGILPEENGDTIVAYTGITTKTGSDFDIDKMYLMMANYTLEDDKLVYTSYDNSIPNKKQSKEALQNRLIELYKSVLTHPKVLKDIMKPLDNDLLKNDIIDLVPNDTSGIMFHFDAYNDMQLRYEYTGGKAGVGQEANALVDINRIGNLSINNYFIGWGTKNSKGDTKFDEEYSEELSEEDLNYYVKELIKPGASAERVNSFKEEIRKVKISDSLTAILNAFVDIAKDPYISRGNWTTSTTNTGNLMLRAGVHPLYVTAFMAQPIIKQYIQYQSSLESILDNNSGDTKSKFKRNLVIESIEKKNQDYSELNKPLSLVYQKLVRSANSGMNNLIGEYANEKLQKALGGEKLSDEKLEEILDVLKEAHSSIFSEQKVKITDRDQYNLKRLRNQIKDNSDGSIQVAILDKFFELQEISKSLKENVDVSKLDTNGMGKNVNTLFSFFNMRQHIKDKEQSGKDKVLNGFESKFVNSPLEKYFKALQEVMRIVQSNPLLFPQGQKDVQDMFNEISNDLYSSPAIEEKLMTELEKSFYTYTMSNFGPFNISSVETRELLDKLPSKFSEFKKANRNKYLILDELQIRNDGKLKLIGLNNRKKSTDFEEKFTDSWRDLLIENPQLAEDLIKYSFITSGFRMNSTQFFTYIPHEYMLKEGINEFIKAFSNENKYDFIDKFYLNNTDKFKYVNKVFDNEIVSEDFITGFIVREPGKSKYYLKRDNGNGIYKLEGYNKNNQAVYIRVNKLGFKTKGSNIVEYGDQFSKDTLELNKDYLHKLKNIVVTSRDKFKENFELDKIADREEDIDNESEVPSNTKVVSDAYGVVSVETNPSKEKTQQFVDIIQPQIKAQAYKENVSATANDMFMYGLRWTRKGNAKAPLNNKSYANKGLPITDAKAKDGYVYDTVDQNGKPLAPISDLQPIISEIEKSLGLDMSDYDAVIGNIYLPGQNIATHRDTTESLSAKNYPVVVYTIGNNSGISVYENEKEPGSASFASDKQTTIPTKNGSIYTFGMDGKGRFEVAHDTPKGIKRDVKFPPITMPNGNVITNYTITLTFRRAADLTENTPVTPNRSGKILAEQMTQPSTSTEVATEPITSMSEITNHSGGAKLSDAKWDQIGREFGVVDHKHYREPGTKTLDSLELQKAGVTATELSEEEYNEGQPKSTIAARQMGRIQETHQVRSNYIIRNWAQVKNSEAVYAIGTIIQKGTEMEHGKIALIEQVKGGTGYAVQMAINEKKPVYVFDGTKDSWFVWNGEKFEKTNTPILTKNFAGIGSRTLSTQEVIDKSLQAIRDVYQATKDSIVNKENVEVKPEVETRQVLKSDVLEAGQYVKYNNETYVVTKQNANGTVQIYNPNISGPNGKISVAKDRLSIINEKAKIVTYKGAEYLVTPRNTIISMVTNKLMNWAENDGNRKAILALANNEILTPETVQVESTSIQSEVKSKVELTVFKPANAQQEYAITAIQDFIKNGDPDEIFILEGKAGTGKTTIVQEAIAEAVAAGKRIQISALSHKAKLVLAQKLDKRFPKKTGSSSIAGLLGMTMNQETGEFEPGYGMERPIESADIIIVDEASMVNEEALQLIMQEKRKYAKVIFLGDRGQLPPIRKISSDEISLVFESENKASLTERVRQGEESPILPFADYFWDNSESQNSKLNPIPDGEIKDKLSDKGNLVFIKNLYDSFDDVVKVFKQGIDTGNFNVIKIVTYKNATRQEYNKKIRKEIFGEDVKQFVEKDQIMFQNNYSLDSKTNFSNSDEFNVVSVKEQEKNGYKVFQIGVNMDEGSSAITYFPVLNNEDKQKFNEDVSNLFEAAAKLPKGDLRKFAYQKAWSLKNMFAEIDYSYAITSHKSQGSTYDNVIVDLKDIYGVGATSAKSKSRSVYTAITRAKNTAILITSKAETNEDNVRKSLSLNVRPSLTEEEQQKVDELKKYCNPK